MRVLIISGIDGATRRYRCFHLLEQLTLLGLDHAWRKATDLQLYVDVVDYDVFILHRVPYSPLIAHFIELAQLQGKPVIFETDDLIFDPAVYEQIAFVDTLSPEAAYRFRQDLAHLAQTFQKSNAVITSTEALAVAARQHGAVAYVHRNTASQQMLEISARAHQARAQKSTEQVVIGYFSGTGSHNRDFAMISPALLQIMATQPHVWLHVSGHLDLIAEFNPYQDRIRRAPYIPWEELPYLLAQVDLNLAPLELDNSFAQAKSEIKYMEAALVGVPTIASPMESYQYAIQHGKNGFLATTADEWAEYIHLLIHDATLRQTVGEQARQSVYEYYTPEQRSRELLTTLQIIVAQTPHQTAPNLAHEVAERLQQCLADSLVIQQEQQVQIKALHDTLSDWETKLFTFEQRYQVEMKKHEAMLLKMRQELAQTKDAHLADLKQLELKHQRALQDILNRLQPHRREYA